MQQQPTRLQDVTEINYDAAVAFALAFEAAGCGSAEQGLAELDACLVLMAACWQIVTYWEVAVVEPSVAYRAELAHAAERERVRAMLEELAAERPHITAYSRAIEAMEDGAEWWHERGALVVQRVRGSRHVIGAAGCSCDAAHWGRRCWAWGLSQAFQRLERRRLAA